MYKYWQHEIKREPCANCGKENEGIMKSTSWGHNYSCCSEACGKRLGKRIENGMVNLKPYNHYLFGFGLNDEVDTVKELRIRIKQLENQLKRNGIKPVRR